MKSIKKLIINTTSIFALLFALNSHAAYLTVVVASEAEANSICSQYKCYLVYEISDSGGQYRVTYDDSSANDDESGGGGDGTGAGVDDDDDGSNECKALGVC